MRLQATLKKAHARHLSSIVVWLEGSYHAKKKLRGPCRVSTHVVQCLRVGRNSMPPFLFISVVAAIAPLSTLGQSIRTLYRGQPVAIAVDPSGGLYIAEAEANCVRFLSQTAGAATAFAGCGAAGEGGRATDANISRPTGIVYDGVAGIVIADSGNGVLRRVDAASGKIVTVLAGTAAGAPAGIAMLSAGGDYLVAFSAMHVVQRVSPASGAVQPFAGTLGSLGFAGDGGAATAARLTSPSAVISDGNGGALIADFGNFCVRAVSTRGIITTGTS
jgi:hypothetical protein